MFADAYHIYYAIDDDENFKYLHSTTASTYTHLGVAPGRTYTYTLIAEDNGEVSGLSEFLTITPHPTPPNGINTLTNLRANDVDIIAEAISNPGAYGVYYNAQYQEFMIEDSAHWPAGKTYYLSRPLYVFDANGGEAAILTIDPGVIVLNTGSSATSGSSDYGALIVGRNAKLIAEGTAKAPIYFSTSAYYENIYGADIDGDGSIAPYPTLESKGLWGGLILLGDDFVANYDTTTEVGEEEVSKTQYSNIINMMGASEANKDLLTYGNFSGSQNNAHSAGSLSYVSVSHAGIGDSEHGLTFAGVGAGTKLSVLEVLSSAGDGMQFLGGSANLLGGAVIYQGEDALDIDEGYDGNIQFFANIQDPNSASQGLNLSGNRGGSSDDEISTPIISNFTLIGGVHEDSAIKFDNYFGGYLVNGVVTNFTDLIEVTDNNIGGVSPYGANFFGVYENVSDNQSNTLEITYNNEMIQQSGLGLGVINLNGNRVDPTPLANSPLLKANGATYYDLNAILGAPFWGEAQGISSVGAFPPNNNWLKDWSVADFVFKMFN